MELHLPKPVTEVLGCLKQAGGQGDLGGGCVVFWARSPCPSNGSISVPSNPKAMALMVKSRRAAAASEAEQFAWAGDGTVGFASRCQPCRGMPAVALLFCPGSGSGPQRKG